MPNAQIGFEADLLRGSTGFLVARSMKRKERYIASLDEDYAWIAYKEEGKEFGKLLTTYGGWGMRIEFVPDDEVHRRPVHEVREPKPEK